MLTIEKEKNGSRAVAVLMNVLVMPLLPLDVEVNHFIDVCVV